MDALINHDFYVSLHDNPVRSGFLKTNRAVIHECVRPEKALSFAFFLPDKPDLMPEDRIRVVMNPGYRTMYLSTDGVLSYCKDTYKYDKTLSAAFEQLTKVDE